MTTPSSHLLELLSTHRRPRILVVGDVMLDRYVWGDVHRISPEAPIPVLKVLNREERLGGAGSVVAMLAALEAEVIPATVIADDPDGVVVRDMLEQYATVPDCVLVAKDRTTTVKERLLGRTQGRHPQQVVRIDRESSQPIGSELTGKLLEAIRRHLDEADAILISDYDKGICGDTLVAELVQLARQANLPVAVDPASGIDYRRYAGCTCVTPNRTEAGQAVGQTIASVEAGLEAARKLLSFEIESAVVTLDRDGIAWADASGRFRHFPVHPRQVYDITGAGDMVLVALGFSLAVGADWPAAIELANLAGGLEVQRLGVVPVTRRELVEALTSRGFSNSHKIVSLTQLDAQLRERRTRGERIVLTNGCFDLLHPGHVATLQFARNQGTCLVVGVNSDRSIRELKGQGRPVMDQQGRAELLSNMECVDYVIVFDDASVAGLVQRLSPDVLVKSSEYSREEVVGHEIVERYGGDIVLAPLKSDYSTSGLIAKIQGLPGREGDSV